MLTKADINALFGTSGLSLKKMYKKASEILDKKFSAWVPDYVEDVIFIKQDIITELDMTRGKVSYWVSGIQMRYMDAEMVDILKKAVFRFMNKHGDIETFCSTSDTRLRVLKMGDETQLHLESAKKMKLD